MSRLRLAQYHDLKDKTVFISGGATGIGGDLVDAFALQGSQVHFVDIDAEAGAARAQRLAGITGRRPAFQACDVTDSAALAACVNAAAQAGGRLDVLVNNAANDTRHGAEESTPEAWDRSIAVNLKHQFFAAQAAFTWMKRAGGGSIINLGSVAPTLRHARLSIYCTAKAGVVGLTHSLARDFGEHGVRVNTLVPGCIITQRQLDLWISPQDEARIQAEQCLHRRLIGEDVAQMALFLGSEVSSACSAQEFIVDGGLI